MAYDKIIDSTKMSTAMTATADKIRAGTGNTGKLTWDESKGFADSIPAAVAQATPSISVSSSGLITASATQTGGFVASGTKSATKQLSTQSAKTVTPGTSNQTAVSSGKYTTGAVTVKGDSNLKAANIAKGVSIFGITGTYAGGGSNVASGTFTQQSGLLCDQSFTVSGLSFKPTRVIFWTTGSAYGWGSGIICADSTTQKVTIALTDSDDYSWAGTYDFNEYDAGYMTITFNSNGFTIAATEEGDYSQIRLGCGTYAYIAIG